MVGLDGCPGRGPRASTQVGEQQPPSSSPTAGESWKELELGAGLCQSLCSGSERRRAWHCASPQPMEM